MKLETIRLHEVNELEPMVLESLNDLEEGLVALDNQLTIGSGRPDILAVDQQGSLCVIELKAELAVLGIIEQATRYYAWFTENLALVSRAYPKIKPDRPVRIILIAPEFEVSVRRLASMLNVEIVCFTFLAVKDKKSGDFGVVFRELELNPPTGAGVCLRSKQDIIDYVTNPDARNGLQRVIAELEHKGCEVVPWRGGTQLWLEIRHGNQDIGYLRARRAYFNSQYYDDNTENYIWPPLRYTSFDEWESESGNNIYKWIEKDVEQTIKP
ncbi:endonuclease NucS domain-containing protein [Vibrio fluvialis]|uniref:endonuclease NucS domain-containing protein n=1 Tax=Vibrio fluvialis TaxID=676 RepID=UPI00155839D6|nr:endonuclease NucS domain-containing protein [Vibrio fluvialis]